MATKKLQILDGLNFVSYAEQNLTEEQKAQVMSNIGVTAKEVVVEDGKIRPWEYDSGLYLFKTTAIAFFVMKKTGAGEAATESSAAVIQGKSTLLMLIDKYVNPYDSSIIWEYTRFVGGNTGIRSHYNKCSADDTWTYDYYTYLPSTQSPTASGKVVGVNSELRYQLMSVVNSVNGQTGDVTTPQSDWNQTDEAAVDYIKNKPEIATDEEIIDMLAQEDMLVAVADVDGSILSDENNNILTW